MLMAPRAVAHRSRIVALLPSFGRLADEPARATAPFPAIRVTCCCYRPRIREEGSAWRRRSRPPRSTRAGAGAGGVEDRRGAMLAVFPAAARRAAFVEEAAGARDPPRLRDRPCRAARRSRRAGQRRRHPVVRRHRLSTRGSRSTTRSCALDRDLIRRGAPTRPFRPSAAAVPTPADRTALRAPALLAGRTRSTIISPRPSTPAARATASCWAPHGAHRPPPSSNPDLESRIPHARIPIRIRNRDPDLRLGGFGIRSDPGRDADRDADPRIRD